MCTGLCMSMYVCVCVCVFVCLCVCVCKRMSVCERERERALVCMDVCVVVWSAQGEAVKTKNVLREGEKRDYI